MPTDDLFYAAQPSYFSAKVRACFQYKRIPYTEVPFNFDAMRDVIVPRTGMSLFPVVVCPDDATLQDGCDIVVELERRHPERPVIPTDPVLRVIAMLFEVYADEFLMICGGYYRWVPKPTRDWAVRMFGILAGWGATDKQAAARAAEMLGHSIEGRLPALGADRPEIASAIECMFERLCLRLEEHFAADESCLLGAKPCLADVAMMNGMFGHHWRDWGPASEFLHRECIRTGIWIDRMHAAAGERGEGELRVAPSLLPVLAEIGAATARMAKGILERADEVLSRVEPGARVQGSLGRIDTFLLDEPMNRPIGSYTAWKLQRLIDAYREVPADRSPEMDRLLEAAGYLEVCRHRPKWRMEKRRFRLHVAGS